jgi:hypothetical protein
MEATAGRHPKILCTFPNVTLAISLLPADAGLRRSEAVLKQIMLSIYSLQLATSSPAYNHLLGDCFNYRPSP